MLLFGVKRSYEGTPTQPEVAARAMLLQLDLTVRRRQDRRHTQERSYTQGHGWRMAVILNGHIVSDSQASTPPLRDGVTISGRFSQREINQLAADLKAGRLSFTPRILSEQNVSPELGQEERPKGILASILPCPRVVAMVGYYHFAGLSPPRCLFNLLIMWGVLQNIGAALTLPGIAGIVLTIGMAVDANVLVFERIREEFKTIRTHRLCHPGRVTAKPLAPLSTPTSRRSSPPLILIQFDSGPIKGFAVTLIIGILSSMFTALS